jgi:SRSO17 transposase
MTLAQISSLGRLLTAFLGLFADCFAGTKGRALFRVFVSGLLSDVQRKNVEAIALRMQASVRTLQRFLESIKWNERLLVDRCQQLVAAEHADPEAIGLIDETGVAKSGAHTAGAQRQYNGNRGKIENAVVHVALGYSTGDFHTLLDARVYLPEEWANDPARRKKLTCLTMCDFRRNPRLP